MRVDLQHNWVIEDILICAALLVCEAVDIVSNLAEVSKFPTRNLVWEHGIGLLACVHMVETKFEGTSSDDTISTR